MPTFLDQLVQTGALKGPDPMESYRNVLALKTAQTNIRTAELGQEAKVMEMVTAAMRNVRTVEDLKETENWYINKLGGDPASVPDTSGITTDEKAREFASWVGASTTERLKMLEGKFYKMYNTETGAVVDIRSPEHLDQLHAAKMLDKNKNNL